MGWIVHEIGVQSNVGRIKNIKLRKYGFFQCPGFVLHLNHRKYIWPNNDTKFVVAEMYLFVVKLAKLFKFEKSNGPVIT